MKKTNLKIQNNLLRMQINELKKAVTMITKQKISSLTTKKKKPSKKSKKKLKNKRFKKIEQKVPIISPSIPQKVLCENSSRKQQPNQIQDNKEKPTQRSLMDSFESYYQSQEQNLFSQGRTQLSYIDYKNTHLKGSRRKQREINLVKQLQALKRENTELKLKIQKQSKKRRKSISVLSMRRKNKKPKKKSKKSHSKTAVKIGSRKSSFSLNTFRDQSPSRTKCCQQCDNLLSGGKSTISCSKHGFQYYSRAIDSSD